MGIEENIWYKGAWGRGVCGFGDHSIDIGWNDSRTIENYVFWEMLRKS